MSLGADSDTSENGDQNPVPVYSSTLLQQFVEKTALLSEPRKRRSKASKKLNDPEYPCASNVSPDSGIQSVDNSPLHLAISPVSPPAPTQSPIQTVVPKPAVNVDRVLYPPKRKPGRPAKTVSTQPRGPGRPRLKPEIVEKIEKIEKAEKIEKNEKKDATSVPQQKTSKEEPNKRSKLKSAQHKTGATREEKEEEGDTTKKLKEKPICQKKRSCNVSKQFSQGRVSGKRNNAGSPSRVKCLSRTVTSKYGKDASQCDGRMCKKMRKDKPSVNNKSATPLRRQKQSSCERIASDRKLINSGRRSLKENRSNSAPSSKRQGLLKKNVAPVTRRVLKENKNSKRTSATFETNGVGVQTLISLPVGQVLKSEKVERPSNKCDKATQPIHNHCHKHHHHHKHRRRLPLNPPKNPIRIDPCIIQELEKLIEEFSRSCSLGRNNASVGYSELPQIFRVKKLTKKRKGDVASSDDQKLKRRSKKEKVLPGIDSKSGVNATANSNPNEQRLPLKKRHYHVSSPHSSQSSNSSSSDPTANESNCTESHIEEAIEATITRYGGGSSASSSQEDAVPVTPKKRHRDTENSSPEKSVAASSESPDEKPLSQADVQPRRKKKIVKDLRVTVTKLPVESGHIERVEKPEKIDGKPEKSSSEKCANDSKSSKAHGTDKGCGKNEKIIAEKLIKSDRNQADKLEKNNDHSVSEHVRLEKNIKTDAAEFHATESYEESETASESKPPRDNVAPNLANPLNSAAALVLTKKKMRRRKAINRTGFPTLKKKKKKKRSLSTSEASTSTTAKAALTSDDNAELDADLDGDQNSSKEGLEDAIEESKPSVLSPDIQETISSKEQLNKHANDLGNDDNNEPQTHAPAKLDSSLNLEDSDSTKQDGSFGHACANEVTESRAGQLRVRKDLVETESDENAAQKFCPVKFEKIQDSRTYDENAPLEESLGRYETAQQQQQRCVVDGMEENTKHLPERSTSQANIKTEHSAPLNGNNQKKRRGSSSPCTLAPRNMKRLRSSGYDTENDSSSNNNVLVRGDSEGKHTNASHTRKKQSRWKKRYLQGGVLQDYGGKDCESKTRSGGTGSSGVDTIGKSKIAGETNDSASTVLLSASYQCGKFLRQRKMSFHLPYDLWWLHTQSRLPSRESVPSWNYK